MKIESFSPGCGAVVSDIQLAQVNDADMVQLREAFSNYGLLFFRDQGTWTAMPYTFGVESPDLPAVDYTISMGFGYELGFLEVFYEASTDAVDRAPGSVKDSSPVCRAARRSSLR